MKSTLGDNIQHFLQFEAATFRQSVELLLGGLSVPCIRLWCLCCFERALGLHQTADLGDVHCLVPRAWHRGYTSGTRIPEQEQRRRAEYKVTPPCEQLLDEAWALLALEQSLTPENLASHASLLRNKLKDIDPGEDGESADASNDLEYLVLWWFTQFYRWFDLFGSQTPPQIRSEVVELSSWVREWASYPYQMVAPDKSDPMSSFATTAMGVELCEAWYTFVTLKGVGSPSPECVEHLKSRARSHRWPIPRLSLALL